MTIRQILLASITTAFLIIGSTVDGHDIAREVEAPRSKISTSDLGIGEEAEQKLHDLNFRFEQLQSTDDEQKRALELAEKELKRAKLEASLTFKERTTNLAATFWKERVKPSIIALRDKTTGKLVHVKEWSEPHIGSAKTKWVPAAKQQFGVFMFNMRPYMKELSTKTIKVYEASKSTMKPHFDKVQEMDLSYHKKWVPPAKQQFENFMINMEPYMKELPTKVVEVYEMSKSTMKPYFDKVQEMALSYYKLQSTNDEQKRALELAEKEPKRAKLEASLTFKERTTNLAATFWKERAKPSIIAIRDKTSGKLVHAKEWSEPHIGSAKTLQSTNDEQKRALELAEKELKRAKLEASLTFKERTTSLAATFWKERAKPSIISLRDKTTGKLVHAKEWSEPHIGSAKTKWVPAAKQQFGIFMFNMRPYMKGLSTKTIKVYEASKSTMKPHFDKVQEMDLSYYKKWVPPAKQQFENFMINMEPYMKELPTKVVEVYEISKSTMKSHFDKVQEMSLSYYKKWIPAAKQPFEIFMINMEPIMKELSAKIIDVYALGKGIMKPHFFKVQEVALSYYKEAWSHLMPYVDQIFVVTKPYVEIFQTLKLITKYAAYMHDKILGRKNTCHLQAKSNINEDVMKHDVTGGYAATELASVKAYVLLAFPVFFLYKFLRSIFFTKKRRQLKRTSHESEPQRKTKRSRRADN